MIDDHAHGGNRRQLRGGISWRWSLHIRADSAKKVIPKVKQVLKYLIICV